MDIQIYLKNLIADKEARMAELKTKIKEAQTADEVRAFGSQLESLEIEKKNAENQLSELQKEETAKRNACKFEPQKAMNIDNNSVRNYDNSRESMEYRKAFMDYVQKGKQSDILQIEKRQNAGISKDLGVLLPETIVQQIIQDIEEVYGQLYSKVKKTNLPGAVKYPIGSFNATFNRITESTVSERQKGGEITGYVEFSYNIGEIRLARTLLQTVLSVPVFEQEFAKVIVKAYVEAMDKEIINGVATNGQCEGIITEANKATSRIPASNIIEFTASDIADWVLWEKKFFAEIPLSLENAGGEFVFAKQTYVSNLCTLKDSTDQPIKKAGFDASDKQHKFNEYNVNRVEQDIFKSFDNCTDGEYFGMFWVPEMAYCINSNLEFSVVDYFDQETNQYIKKAIVINDGKILDPKYIYLFKKSV